MQAPITAAERKSKLLVAALGEKPASFWLEHNYPNPFNPATEIRFSLAEDTHVTLILYNTPGQEVGTLIDADAPAGQHAVKLDAARLSSGMYIYRVQAGNFTVSKEWS